MYEIVARDIASQTSILGKMCSEQVGTKIAFFKYEMPRVRNKGRIFSRKPQEKWKSPSRNKDSPGKVM